MNLFSSVLMQYLLKSIDKRFHRLPKNVMDCGILVNKILA